MIARWRAVLHRVAHYTGLEWSFGSWPL